MLGTDLNTGGDPTPTISINKFSSGNDNAFEVAGNSVFDGKKSTNTLNSEGDNDVVFQRNDVEFFKLDKFTEDSIEKEAIICSKQLRANGNILVRNLQIKQISSGIEYADFRVENENNSIIRFFVGSSNNINLQISQTATTNEILLNRNTKCSLTSYTNTIDTYSDADFNF